MFSSAFCVQEGPFCQVMTQQLTNTDQPNDIRENHICNIGNHDQTTNVQDMTADPGLTLSQSGRALRLKQSWAAELKVCHDQTGKISQRSLISY